jgi:hypothetical protein
MRNALLLENFKLSFLVVVLVVGLFILAVFCAYFFFLVILQEPASFFWNLIC